MFLMRHRYYFAWVLCDAGCNAAGFGYQVGLHGSGGDLVGMWWGGSGEFGGDLMRRGRIVRVSLRGSGAGGGGDGDECG
eukprot:3045461-Rhodomonas_salina.2